MGLGLGWDVSPQVVSESVWYMSRHRHSCSQTRVRTKSEGWVDTQLPIEGRDGFPAQALSQDPWDGRAGLKHRELIPQEGEKGRLWLTPVPRKILNKLLDLHFYNFIWLFSVSQFEWSRLLSPSGKPFLCSILVILSLFCNSNISSTRQPGVPSWFLLRRNNVFHFFLCSSLILCKNLLTVTEH